MELRLASFKTQRALLILAGISSPRPSSATVLDQVRHQHGRHLDQLTGQSTPGAAFFGKNPASTPGNHAFPAFPAFPGKPKTPADPKAELKEVIRSIAAM